MKFSFLQINHQQRLQLIIPRMTYIMDIMDVMYIKHTKIYDTINILINSGI